MGNYPKEGGAFNSYVFASIQTQYPQWYEQARKPYEALAREKNIKLDQYGIVEKQPVIKV